MKKKVAVLGATGMLGSMVYNVFKEKYDLILFERNKNNFSALEGKYGGTQNHTIYEFDFNVVSQDYLKGFKNFPESPSFKKFLSDIRNVDAVVNCAGITIPHSLKDPYNTFFINSALPHLLASVFKEKMIHITTDCVFNGLEGFPYNENSKASPTDLYGLSKWLGEPKDCLTLRTSIIGPEISGFQSLLEWFLKQEGETIKGFTKHFWNGLTTKELAKVLGNIIDTREEYPMNGVFHIFSTEISKYDMLLKFKEKYRTNCNINPDDSSGINRTLSTIYPLCKSLQIPSFDDMIKDL